MFATEVISTDPETWLALHPKGPAVFEVVTDIIDDPLEIELAESHLNKPLEEEESVDDETAESDQTAPVDDQEVTLKDVAEMRYEALASTKGHLVDETDFSRNSRYNRLEILEAHGHVELVHGPTRLFAFVDDPREEN